MLYEGQVLSLVSPMDDVINLTIHFDTTFGLGEHATKEIGNEAVETIKILRRTIPDLKEDRGLKSKLASVNQTSYSDTLELCSHYNDKISDCKIKWKATGKKPPYFTKRAVGPLLRHILRQCYERAVDNPSSLNSYPPFSSAVYGETSFELVESVIKFTHISKDDVFIDLGSGVGQVVLQVAASTDAKTCIGIEKAEYPALCAEKMVKAFYMLMNFYGKPHQMITLDRDDFLVQENRDKILQASVVFVNNYAFGPDVDHQLKEIFKNLNEGSRIVSSKAYRPRNFRITDRNLCDVASILRTKDLPPMKVSWTSTNLSYILHTIDRSLLEEYFASMRPRMRRIESSAKAIKNHLSRCNSERNLIAGDRPSETENSTSTDKNSQRFFSHSRSLTGSLSSTRRAHFKLKKRCQNSTTTVVPRLSKPKRAILLRKNSSESGSLSPAIDIQARSSTKENSFCTLSCSPSTSSSPFDNTMDSTTTPNSVSVKVSLRSSKTPSIGNSICQIKRNLKSRALAAASEGRKTLRRGGRVSSPLKNRQFTKPPRQIKKGSCTMPTDNASRAGSVEALFASPACQPSTHYAVTGLDGIVRELSSQQQMHSSFLQERECLPLAIRQIVQLFQQQLVDWHRSMTCLGSIKPQQQCHNGAITNSTKAGNKESALFLQLRQSLQQEVLRQKKLQELVKTSDTQLRAMERQAVSQLGEAMTKLQIQGKEPADLCQYVEVLLRRHEELKERIAEEQADLRRQRLRYRELKEIAKTAGGCRVLQKLRLKLQNQNREIQSVQGSSTAGLIMPPMPKPPIPDPVVTPVIAPANSFRIVTLPPSSSGEHPAFYANSLGGGSSLCVPLPVSPSRSSFASQFNLFNPVYFDFQQHPHHLPPPPSRLPVMKECFEPSNRNSFNVPVVDFSVITPMEGTHCLVRELPTRMMMEQQQQVVLPQSTASVLPHSLLVDNHPIVSSSPLGGHGGIMYHSILPPQDLENDSNTRVQQWLDRNGSVSFWPDPPGRNTPKEAAAAPAHHPELSQIIHVTNSSSSTTTTTFLPPQVLQQICHLSEAFKESHELESAAATAATAFKKEEDHERRFVFSSSPPAVVPNHNYECLEEFCAPPPPPPPAPHVAHSTIHLPPRERWRSTHTSWRCSSLAPTSQHEAPA